MALRSLALLLLLPFVVADSLHAQGAGDGTEDSIFLLVGPSGARIESPIVRYRGYAAVSSALLEDAGWIATPADDRVVLRLADAAVVELVPGNPFFTWDGDDLQLADVPYFFGRALYIPLQFLTDFLPRRLPDDYAHERGSSTLSVLTGERWTPGGSAADRAAPGAEPAAMEPEEGPQEVVVVIDPGHGGRDTGALGPGNVHEKDIALRVGRALAEELKDEEGIEVYLTRDSDVFVPLWQRGERATRWKGDRPGVFLSLHVNAVSGSSAARGFETYFLSEARTDHERRVAALENASMELESAADGGPATRSPDLGFILTDLRNRDHQRWSALLAQLIQDEIDDVHPGPNRGVKQAPLAVITNALMPSALIEMGFITNDAEAGLLTQERFQSEVAHSIAEAVRLFFDHYPPGAENVFGSSQ